MEAAVTLARKTGLANVHWAGFSDIPGMCPSVPKRFMNKFSHQQSAIAATYAHRAGCKQIQRKCGKCDSKLTCELKGYHPRQST